MHSALLTAAMLALGAAHQVQAAAYIPERVGTAVVSMQPALVSTIKASLRILPASPVFSAGGAGRRRKRRGEETDP